MFVILMISLAFAINCLGQVPSLKYPDLKPMLNFDKPKFTGVWNDIARFPNIFEAEQKCATFTYTLHPQKGSFTSLLSTQDILLGIHRNLSARVEPIEGKPSSVFNAYFPTFSPISIGKLNILDTDYDNYAVVTIITPVIGSVNLQMAWIWSRKPTLSAKLYQHSTDILRSNGLSPDKLELTNQKNC